MNGIEIAKRILQQEYGALSGSDVALVSDSLAEKYISICGILESMDKWQVRERLQQIGLSHSSGDVKLVKLADFVRTYPFEQVIELTATVR